MESLLLMVAMIAVFYFLIIRPENKRKKQAEQMRSSLKKGDRVTTIGGMVGKIVQVNDSTIVFETSEDRVRIEVTKWAVQSTGAMEQAAAQKSGKKADKVEEKAEEKSNILNGLNFARKVVVTQECDFLVLDEILGLLDCGIITVEGIADILKHKDESMHIVMTGWNFPEELRPYVDVITTLNTEEVHPLDANE